MSPKLPTNITSKNIFLEGFYTHLLPGLAYLALAHLSITWLSIQPSEASAVWPAAGVSITAILLRGYRACIGLFVALMMLYANSWLDTESAAALVRSLLLMTLLSVAAVLQAAGAVWLVCRLFGGLPSLVDDKEIAQFLLVVGPLASFVASLLATYSFILFGIIDWQDFLVSWVTWWVGDTIGAIVMVPMLLALFANKKSSLYTRRLAVGLPMGGVLVVIIALFVVTKNHESQQRTAQFNRQAEMLHTHFEERLNAGVEVLYSLRSFFISSVNVSHTDFSAFTQHTLSRYPEIQALEWIPRLPHSARAKYEENHSGMARKIIERDRDGLFQAAAQRQFYYPVTYIEPYVGNKRALGFNVASHPVASNAVSMARQTDGIAFTAPVRLVQESGEQRGVVVYLQVHHKGVDYGLSNEGLVAAVYRMGDFVSSVLDSREGLAAYLNIELLDITDTKELIFSSVDPEVSTNNMLARSAEYVIGGRTYQFNYTTKPEFYLSFIQWSSWIILLAGMVFTALLGGWLLSLTGRTLRVGQLVGEKTASLQYEIEERRRAEQELRKVSKAVEFSPNMVLITRTDGEIEYSSPKLTEETGFSAEDVIGQNIDILHYGRPGETSYKDVWPELSNKQVWRGEIVNRKKSGDLYWAQVSIAPIYNLDDELTHYVVTLQDITENRLISEQISYQASHDQLTALVNRREFEVRLDALLKTQCQSGVSHAFCFLDLDQFKVVNDTSGHVAGDELLRQVAALLQERVRSNDTLARLGGDEFGILLHNCPMDKAWLVAEGIRDAIAQFKFCWEQQVFSIGVSIGVVEINEHSAGMTEIMKHADSACYTAKDSGRNRVHLYSEGNEMLAQREGEIKWISEINSALDENRFVLYGQLIVPLQNSQLKPDIEILLRMKSRDGTIVPPGAFLPAAERYQLSGQIDQWVVDHAFAWLERNFTQFSQYFGCCAINLSGGSLGDPSLKQAIITHLDDSSLLPYKVKFEITETSAIANLSEAQRFINSLKAFGCQFSLDDFGSGLSSFAYLKNLRVDNLKIDGQFVKGILDDRLDLAMVKSINDIGHVMGKTTIAEFVENDEVTALLREIGVDYGQGYGLGLPEPLDLLLQHVSGDDDR